jgi:hypothetical protein
MGEFCLKQHFKGIFHDFITAHAQEHQYYYFRFQNGPHIQISRAEKLINGEILPENCILKAVFLTITAHAQKYQKYHFQYQN